jgi:G3E family GTPase
MRSDLIATLRDLYLKRTRGGVPRFRRILIETSGLADPAPILHTLMNDPLIAARFRLDGVVATVDAVNGMDQLDRQPESVKQAAMADRLLLTKTDLATVAAVDELRERLRRINPAAPVYTVVHGNIDPQQLLDAGLYNPAVKGPDVRRWLNAECHDHAPEQHGTHTHPHHAGHRHDERIRTFCLTYDEPLDWPAFADALRSLMARHGRDLLRVKGVLDVSGEAGPVVVHAVQHLFHPPISLPAWPDADRRSRLVFITRDIERGAVELELRMAGSRPEPGRSAV